MRVLGNEKELAVGEDAVNVEQKKPDFAGSGLSREFGHWRDSNILKTRAGSRKPENGKMASEFLEVAIGCNETGLVKRVQRGRQTVYVRNLVNGLYLSGSESL